MKHTWRQLLGRRLGSLYMGCNETDVLQPAFNEVMKVRCFDNRCSQPSAKGLKRGVFGGQLAVNSGLAVLLSRMRSFIEGIRASV
ncbi:MAG: hypothetical protein AAF266_13010 [Planctomycetota bacterium]